MAQLNNKIIRVQNTCSCPNVKTPIQSLSIAHVNGICCYFRMLQLDIKYSGWFGGSFWVRAGASIKVIHT